jgi:uncharacterized protein YbjT (DUF2867 family)
MRVLVTGATGFVGSHLVPALVEAGHEVVALVYQRRPSFPSSVETVSGDVLDLDSLKRAARGCQGVIHLVGIIREFPSRGITFQALHVEATRNMIQACRGEGISLFLHMSALGARADSAARYHRTKFAAEELVRQSGLDYAIFRPSLILGAGSRFLEDMRRLMAFKLVGLVGGGGYRMQPVAVEDVVRAFVLALERLELRGQTWELCGPRVYTLRELLETMARTWGKRVVFFPLPVGPLRFVARFLDRFSWFPVTREQLTMLEEGSVCRDGSFYSEAGFAPREVEEVLKEV